MTRPRLLDWFCCEGAASEGYRRAGFDVYGVDLFKHEKLDADGKPVLDKRGKPVKVGFSQDRYPFPSLQADALMVMGLLLAGKGVRFTNGEVLGLNDFDAMHASPPCQHASAGTRAMRAQGDTRHPALIEPTRRFLEATSLPWVIENVSGAALRDPMMLCGSMFYLNARDEDGFPLRLERHRLFESNIALQVPSPCEHDPNVWVGGVYGGGRGRKPGQTAAEHHSPGLCGVDRYPAHYPRRKSGGGMSSPTQGAWECRHGIDARDHCQRCISPPPPKWVVAVDDFQDNRIHLHSLLAQAWDEGFQAACDETLTGFGPEGPADERNPYVEEAMRWPR